MKVIITLEATRTHMTDDAALLELIKRGCLLRPRDQRRVWQGYAPLINRYGDRHMLVCCVNSPNNPHHISLTFECSTRAAGLLVSHVDGEACYTPDCDLPLPDRPLVNADDAALPLLDTTHPRIRISRDYNGF